MAHPPHQFLGGRPGLSGELVAGVSEVVATTKELMRRMGHSTVRAAMRYQHSTDRRDREIAAEMSRRASRAQPEGSKER